MAVFSPNLFWDVSIASIDMLKHKRYIIQRVLEYGTLSDWKAIKAMYGVKTIAEEMKQVRSLDDKTLHFICTAANVKKEEFRCYTTKQSRLNDTDF